MLLNLLANALKVSPTGSTILLGSSVDARLWRVWLEDQGPGIAAEHHERIFERFVRLDANDDSEDGGSGLGLTICRSILSLHKGKIWAERSPVATGLRIVFTIPATESAPSGRGAEHAV